MSLIEGWQTATKQ